MKQILFTGYFARATENKHGARHTQVHILKSNGVCLCGYRPHRTMKFQWCAYSAVVNYVECERCVNRALKYLESTKVVK